MTPYEVASGRPYTGKVCEFGEPILAYIYNAPGPKGGARWEPGVFLTKTLTNDMFLIGVGNTLRLTRSVKRIYEDWHDQSNLHMELVVHSWMVEVLGNRMKKRVKESTEAISAPVVEEDEAASDPPTEEEKEPVGEETIQMAFPESMTLTTLSHVDIPVTPVPWQRCLCRCQYLDQCYLLYYLNEELVKDLLKENPMPSAES